MQFLSILVHPRTDNSEYGTVDGAYAACWVNEPTLELAESSARAFLEAAGWDAEEVDEAYPVTRERYLGQEQLGKVRPRPPRRAGCYTSHLARRRARGWRLSPTQLLPNGSLQLTSALRRRLRRHGCTALATELWR